MIATPSRDRLLPTDNLELAEFGFAHRDIEPAVTEAAVEQLRRLHTDTSSHALADVLEAFQLWRREEFVDATAAADRAVEVLAETDLLLWSVRARSIVSGIMLSQGLSHEGIEHIFETLELATELGDRDRLFTLNHNLAAGFADLGEVKRAEERFALAEVWADPDSDDLHFLAFNRADMYLTAGRPHEARAVLENAAHLWEGSAPSQTRVWGLSTQCDAALAVNELAEADRYLLHAKQCLATLGRTERKITLLEAQIHTARGRFEEAEATIAELVEEHEDGDLTDAYRGGTLDVVRLRVDLAEAKGDYESALHLEREASDIQIERLKRNNQRVSRLLIHRYASELEEQSRELATQNDQLGSVVEELQSKTDEALELVSRDFLTGLHNRRHVDTEGARLLDLAHREQRPFSILVIDVDHFKAVNDTYLHVVGDEVLKKLSDLMSTRARDTDVVGRQGGDEFVMLLPSTTLDGAERLAEQLCADVVAANWDETAPGLRVSVTCGAAQAGPDDTFHSLFVAADSRMFELKSMRS